MIKNKIASILLNNIGLESFLDDALSDFFDGDASEWKVGGGNVTAADGSPLNYKTYGLDPYDGSIEIYLKNVVEIDKEKLRKLLDDFGFVYGWVNFHDGTEWFLSKEQWTVAKKGPSIRNRDDIENRSKVEQFFNRLSIGYIKKLIYKDQKTNPKYFPDRL